MIISSMFFPTLIIEKLGLKWTMVLCQSSYSFSIAAQFYPTFGTLIPTSIAVGFAAAPLVFEFFYCIKTINFLKKVDIYM